MFLEDVLDVSFQEGKLSGQSSFFFEAPDFRRSQKGDQVEAPVICDKVTWLMIEPLFNPCLTTWNSWKIHHIPSETTSLTISMILIFGYHLKNYKSNAMEKTHIPQERHNTHREICLWHMPEPRNHSKKPLHDFHMHRADRGATPGRWDGPSAIVGP